jgi:hypothetical protein
MRFLTRSMLTVVALAGISTSANAEVGFGADAVSRYIFRGTDFGNAVSVQPGITYSTDSFEVGAWSSWAIDGGGANENDLYVTVNAGPVAITMTDYYFPGFDTETDSTGAERDVNRDFFSYSDEDGVHILELSASADIGMASVLGAINVSGDLEDADPVTGEQDSRNSFWVQASLPLEVLSSDDVEVGLTVGAGDGVYTTDTDPNLVQVSLDVASGDYFGQFILNPEAEITFLVFGMSF